MVYHVLIWKTETFYLETVSTNWRPLVYGLVYIQLQGTTNVMDEIDSLRIPQHLEYLTFIQVDRNMPTLE